MRAGNGSLSLTRSSIKNCGVLNTGAYPQNRYRKSATCGDTIFKVVTPGTSPRSTQKKILNGETDERGLSDLQGSLGRIFRSHKSARYDSWEEPTSPNRAEQRCAD